MGEVARHPRYQETAAATSPNDRYHPTNASNEVFGRNNNGTNERTNQPPRQQCSDQTLARFGPTPEIVGQQRETAPKGDSLFSAEAKEFVGKILRSKNAAGDAAALLGNLHNVKELHKAPGQGGSQHLHVGLDHSVSNPAPHIRGGPLGTTVPGPATIGGRGGFDCDLKVTAQGITVDNISKGDMHSQANTPRILAGRQNRYGDRVSQVDTRRIELHNGVAYTTSDVQNEAPKDRLDARVERRMAKKFGDQSHPTTALYPHNLDDGPLRNAISDANLLAQGQKLIAAVFNSDIKMNQSIAGKCEFSAANPTATDIAINREIGNSLMPITLTNLHLDKNFSATASASKDKDGNDVFSIDNIKGLKVNLKAGDSAVAGIVPDFLKKNLDLSKAVPAEIEVNQLQLRTENGAQVLHFEGKDTKTGNPITRSVPLAKILEAHEAAQTSDKSTAGDASKTDKGDKKNAADAWDKYIDDYIVKKGGHTEKDYYQACEEAAATKKQLVLVLGSRDNPQLLQDTANGVARKDAVYVYADAKSLDPESPLGQYAQRAMAKYGKGSDTLVVASNVYKENDQLRPATPSYIGTGFQTNHTQQQYQMQTTQRFRRY